VLEGFWSGVGEELSRHWVARVLTPAFAFWAGGLALAWWNANAAEVKAQGWASALTALGAMLGALPVLAQGALVIGGLAVVAASAVVAERLTVPLLRMLEGYWLRPAWLFDLLVGYRRWRHREVDKRFQKLEALHRRGGLSVAEYAELRRLRGEPAPDANRLADLEIRSRKGMTARQSSRRGRDQAWLRTTPMTDDLGMPTRLGDILRAAEHRPLSAYGLDAVICWGALWLTLPEFTRTEVSGARTALDSAVRGWLWGALFLVWTPVSLWALLVGLLIPLLSYRFGILPRAATFGEMIGLAFDLHRMGLYDALHIPRPTTPEEERSRSGHLVTNALIGTLVAG